MATLALDPPGEGTEGLPLQLTTITVAVPQPLSPGTVSVLQGGDCGAAQRGTRGYIVPPSYCGDSRLIPAFGTRALLARNWYSAVPTLVWAMTIILVYVSHVHRQPLSL